MEARSEGAGLCSAPPPTAQLAGARKQDLTNSRGVALVGVARAPLLPGALEPRPLDPSCTQKWEHAGWWCGGNGRRGVGGRGGAAGAAGGLEGFMQRLRFR